MSLIAVMAEAHRVGLPKYSPSVVRTAMRTQMNKGIPMYLKSRSAHELSNDKEVGKLIAGMSRAAKESSKAFDDYMYNWNDAIFEALDNNPSLYDVMSKVSSNMIVDHVTHCDCGHFEHTNDTTTVYGGSVVCDSCKNDDYQWSDVMGEYVSDNEVADFYTDSNSYDRGEPNDIVARSWVRSSADVYTYDGYYVSESLYEYLIEREDYDSEYEDEDEDEDDDSSIDGLSEYHRSYRNWIERNADVKNTPSLGIELELFCDSDRAEAVSNIRGAFPDWYLERDGSLSEDYGFEVITQPLGKAEWATAADKLFPLLQANQCVGYTARNGSYGIHINVARERLSPLQEARLTLFLMAAQNLDFVVAIAQRQYIYGGDAKQPGSFGTYSQRVSNLSKYSSNRKINGLGKYSPLNFHDGIAEFRMFQSTTYKPSFMKNLEFVWALIEWTNPKSATGSSWSHTDFCKWLSARPGTEADYPNLLAFLRKPSYMGKAYNRRIPNNWVHLLPPQTTKSLDIVSGEVDLRLAA